MNDFYDEPSAAHGSATSAASTAHTASTAQMTADPPEPVEAVPEAPPEVEEAKPTPVETESVAVTRFNACRWHETQENAAPYCANRDVLPFAGKNGFNPEAWCPDCTFYKIKRKVKKRSPDEWNEY